MLNPGFGGTGGGSALEEVSRSDAATLFAPRTVTESRETGIMAAAAFRWVKPEVSRRGGGGRSLGMRGRLRELAALGASTACRRWGRNRNRCCSTALARDACRTLRSSPTGIAACSAGRPGARCFPPRSARLAPTKPALSHALTTGLPPHRDDGAGDGNLDSAPNQKGGVRPRLQVGRGARGAC